MDNPMNYDDILASFPRRRLAFLPTPIVELPRLSRFLGGPRIYVKRDDQTGLAFGGNKTRKLEFLVGEALAQGCDTLITGGAAQSNHCRQTAAAASVAGLECHLALGGEAPEVPGGNLLLDGLLGATIHWGGPRRKGEDIPLIAAELRKEGKQPYIIPYGGSNPVGALGYVEAAREATAQLAALDLGPAAIVFASSSGGTHGGLEVGARLFGLGSRLVGVAIDKFGGEGPSLAERIKDIIERTWALFADAASSPSRKGASPPQPASGSGHRSAPAPASPPTPAPAAGSTPLPAFEPILREEFLGGGYGVVGEAEREAIGLAARMEGLLLDPVYSGRAFAGLLSMIRSGEFKASDSVMFWHTGGSPALFPYARDLLP